MSTYFYNRENAKLYISVKETAFRTNSAGKDTHVEAASYADFFALPMRLYRVKYIPVKRKHQVDYLTGVGPDYGSLVQNGYEDCRIEVSGPMNNLSILYYLAKATITNSGTYVHVYATSTARAASPPSCQLFQRFNNDTSAQNNHRLFTGCVVSKVHIAGAVDQTLTLAATFLCANEIAQPHDLTTWPSEPVLTPFHFGDHTIISLTKATTAYDVKYLGFDIDWDDGTTLLTQAGDGHPNEPLHGQRAIKLSLLVAPKAKLTMTDFIDTPLAPATASDLDCTITITRTAVTDLLVFAFEKLWLEKIEDVDLGMKDYYFTQRLSFVIKPVAYETGAKLTITETNSIANTQGYGG